jgi:hypothetical protein
MSPIKTWLRARRGDVGERIDPALASDLGVQIGMLLQQVELSELIAYVSNQLGVAS